MPTIQQPKGSTGTIKQNPDRPRPSWVKINLPIDPETGKPILKPRKKVPTPMTQPERRRFRRVREHLELLALQQVKAGRGLDSGIIPAMTEAISSQTLPPVPARDSAYYQNENRATAREVEIPSVKNPPRREVCRLDLLRFCQEYLRDMFPLPFSPNHHKMLERLQHVILNGGNYTIAAPRGSGKSTLVLATCIWSLLYGHRKFMVILGSNHVESTSRLESIRTTIESNDVLAEDFPGPCYCVRALGGIYNRAGGQTVRGKRTYIRWGGNKLLVFPTIEGDQSSGACIATRSMQSAVRGLQHTTPDGRVLRPDIALLDDPIDTEEAESSVEVEKRERKILKDVLNLGGPGKSLSAIMLITCIAEDDLASRFLDHSRHPDWLGEKYKLVQSMPTNKELWEKYDDLRAKSLEENANISLATSFYRENQSAMDAGAVVDWVERYDRAKGEISAVQHAMNLYFTIHESAFLSEYQNEPPRVEDTAAMILSSFEVEKSAGELARGVVPNNTIVLTTGWDIGKYGIHWNVTAIAPGRVVSVIEYGVQSIDAPTGRSTIPDERVQEKAFEVALLSALRALRDKFSEEPYRRADGTTIYPGFTLVDCGYMDETVNAFVVESGADKFGSVRGCGSGRNQVRYYIPGTAIISRDGNLYRKMDRDGVLRHYANVDAYKQMVHEGFKLPDKTVPGSIALFRPEHRKTHFTYARHITAELQMEKAPGVFVWVPARGRADNHWLDSLGYSLAAVSRIESQYPAVSVTAVMPVEESNPDSTGPAREIRQSEGSEEICLSKLLARRREQRSSWR